MQIIPFAFRTVEPNGLLLNILGRPGSNDFAAVEIYDGVLYFVINVGSGTQRIPFSQVLVNDGAPHFVRNFVHSYDF